MSVLERFSLAPIVREHYKALRKPGQARPSFGTWFVLIDLPLMTVIGSALAGLSLPFSAVGPLLTGTGLLVGGLLSAFVMLTNLRVKVSETDKWSYRTKMTRLIATTAASCLYTAAVALAIVGLLVAGVSLPVLHEPTILIGASSVLVGLGVHLTITFATVLRRLFAVYYELFAADFDVQLRAVDTPDQSAASSKRTARFGGVSLHSRSDL